MKKNITYLYVIKISKWLMLIMPIVALYYTENGLSDFDIYLLQAIYSISVACMEIPSGYAADIIGRKKTLVIGSILGTLGFVVYSMAGSLPMFIVAEIILGLGGSFISGSDSALLYDSLAAEKKESDYLRYEGRITSLGNFAETIAALCGGMIAFYAGYRGVYVCQTFIAAIAIPAAFALTEPPHTRKIERPSMKQIGAICYKSLFIQKELSIAILFSSIIGTATLCMAWTAQVYFVSNNLDERSITPLWVSLNLIVAIVAAFSHKTVETLGYRPAILTIMFLIPCGYITLGVLPLWGGLLSLGVFYAIRGYATPLLKDITNQYCDADTRATVLSIRSLIIRLSFSIIGPAIGLATEHFSLSQALFSFGLLLLIASVICGATFLKRIPQP